MKKSFLLGVLLVALLIVPFANAVAENNVPRTINYTGNLFDYDGKPINKAVDLNVKIYNTQTGGTALWTEDQRNVQVEYGYFSINLGTESPLNLDFKTQYWVELSVNGNSYARVPFTSTPYTFQSMRSFRADTADVAKAVLDGSITLKSLADETRVVTGDVYGTYPELYIKDGVIVSKIGKGQITNYHISSSVSLPPAGPAGGALTGQYPDPKLAENAVETFNILDGTVTYPKLQDANGSMGTILVWNGYSWVESTIPEWQIPEVDGVIGNEVIWATNGLEILTDEDGALGVGIAYGGVTNDMLAGDITADKLAGGIPWELIDGTFPLDKLTPGNTPGQVMWWNELQKEWQLTPNAPREDYVMKWVFDHQAGQALLEWAPDAMSIPFYYEGSAIDPMSSEPNLYSKTMIELVLDGARGTSGNDVHGIAVTINDTEAGSALVLTGSGMDNGNMIPVAVITAKPYVGSASYEKGILNVSAQVGTLADMPSYGTLVEHTVMGTNHGITSAATGLYNNVGDNRQSGFIYGADVMAMSNYGDYTGKVIGVNSIAMGSGSDIAAGVIGVGMGASYNTGVFGGVNVDDQAWETVKNNIPYNSAGVIAYGGFEDQGGGGYLYSNYLALYAYGNSQFDGSITVRDDAQINGNLTVEQYADFNGQLNIDGLFSLDGIEGATKQLMIGQGNGTTPVWISVANLMEDLVAGAGLVGANYDGSITRTFAVEYDATLKMDAAGDAGKIGLNLANPNSWTALQTFATVDINGGNIDATVIGAATPAAATFTNATVNGLLTAATVDLNGGYIDNTIIGMTTPAAGYFTTMTAATATVTGLLTAATVDINGGNIDGTVIGASVPAVGTFTNLFATNETISGLLTAATVDINGGNIDGTTIGASVPAVGTFTNIFATNVTVSGLLTAATVDLNGGNIDGTTIGASVPAVGTFTNIFANNATISGLLTAATVDINGGNIDNTVIGATIPAAATFTNATVTGLLTAATVDINGGNIDNTVIGAAIPAAGTFTNVIAANITSNASINTNGTFALDGVQGAVKELMIGQGVGNTPVWVSVANLMEDLVAGAGLVGANYDGSVTRTFAVEYDATLKMDVAGDAGKLGLDLAHANSWTALQTFATVDINGGNIDATVIGAATPAAATFTNATVNALLTAATVDLNGGNIDGTVIGAAVPAAGTFTNVISPLGTIDDLTSNTIYVNTSLTLDDAAPLFASNGSGTPSEGNPGDLFVSRGAGLSPEWTTTIPLLDVTEFSTDHLVVNDNSMPGMEPYFEVPYSGAREAVFGAPGLGQGVDVTIYGKLVVNNLEVVERIPYLEVYDLDVSHNITLGGTIIGGDAEFDLLEANDITAALVTTDRLHVNVDTYLTDVEAHGLAEFYNGLTVQGGDLEVFSGNDIIAGNNLEVHNAINNPTTTALVQEPVLIDDTEGLNVPNGPIQGQRLALTVAAITAIGDLPSAKAGIINYSDIVNIAQTDLPTPALEGEILYIVNTSAGTVTVLGTGVATQNMIVLVYISGNWYVMP
jgi:hypothetical protein